MKKPSRSAVKAPKSRAPAKSRARVKRVAVKKAAPVKKAAAVEKRAVIRKTAPLELSPDEVTNLERLSHRYEESERAWQRMTAPPEGDETWTKVEEHLFARSTDDPERRWKYFSK